MDAWTIKYRPKGSSEVIGQSESVEKLKRFISDFKSSKKKGALIYGPPGCGKTSSVYAIANELSLEVIELNASDERDKESIERILGAAGQQMSLFSRGKIILVDELDGISGTEDRGGITALSNMIEKTKFPIIITANNPFDSKFNPVRKVCDLIEYKFLENSDLKEALKKICYIEKINYDDIALSAISRRSGGDLRGAILDLQILSESTKRLKMEDVDELSGRRQEESMMSALVKVFKSTTPDIALSAFEDIQEDTDEIFLWVDENLPKEYTKTKDLAAAYDFLSLADIYRGRIKRRQHWRFLSYINNYLSAGIALSKDEKYKVFVKYMPTMRLLKIWQANIKNAKKKAVASKIAGKTHTSVKRALKDTLPCFQVIFKENKGLSEKLAEELKLDSEEINFLRKG